MQIEFVIFSGIWRVVFGLWTDGKKGWAAVMAVGKIPLKIEVYLRDTVNLEICAKQCQFLRREYLNL